jgi:hypothetical protein
MQVRLGVVILLFAPAATAVAFLAHLLVLVRKLLQFIVREMLDVDHLVLRLVDRLDDLVELEVNGAGVAVLRVLDQEHHEERDHGGAGIDDELPGVGVVEVRPGDKPQRDDQQRGEERPFRADQICGLRGKDVKSWLMVRPVSGHASTIGKTEPAVTGRNTRRY